MTKNVNNKIIWTIVGVMLIGAFFRTFHFADWMHYQLDQARDFRIVHAAMVYGPGELPLQGPRAAGTFLRLGPLLYYLEYGSALLFGDTPAGSVAVIALLNIIAIPLFYLFLRQFFTWQLSAGLAGIFSVSLFMVIYSRFGWNPTLVPFFMIVFAYAMVRVGDAGIGWTWAKKKMRQKGSISSDEPCKGKDCFVKASHGNSVNRVTALHEGWWLVIASVALAGVSQMHFLALAAVPLMAVIFILWTLPRIHWKYWLLAIGVFLFLNVPLIVNDVKTGGDNLKEFIAAVTDRGSGENNHNIIDKVVLNWDEHVQYYWLILTGDGMAGLPNVHGRDVQCDYDCRHGFVQGLLSCVLVVLSAVGWFFLYYREENVRRKNFLRFIAVWIGVVFLAYTPLAYDVAPRFFLLNAPVMFAMIGFVIAAAYAMHRKIGTIAGAIVIGACIVTNIYFVSQYFQQVAHAATDDAFEMTNPDRVLKETTRVTLQQMEMIVDWMASKYDENHDPLFVHAQAEYKRAFWERVDFRGIPRDQIPGDFKPLYRQGNYFVIIRTQSDQKSYLKKYYKALDLVEQKNFGTLTVYYFRAKDAFVTNDVKIFQPDDRDPKFSHGVQVRYLWRQVFENGA